MALASWTEEAEEDTACIARKTVLVRAFTNAIETFRTCTFANYTLIGGEGKTAIIAKRLNKVLCEWDGVFSASALSNLLQQSPPCCYTDLTPPPVPEFTASHELTRGGGATFNIVHE